MIRLTPTERKILYLLCHRLTVSCAQIEVALYADKPECDWLDAPERTIQVVVCRMRKKLKALDIEMMSLRATDGRRGTYSLCPASRDKARFILENYLGLLTGHTKIEEAPHVA